MDGSNLRDYEENCDVSVSGIEMWMQINRNIHENE